MKEARVRRDHETGTYRIDIVETLPYNEIGRHEKIERYTTFNGRKCVIDIIKQNKIDKFEYDISYWNDLDGQEEVNGYTEVMERDYDAWSTDQDKKEYKEDRVYWEVEYNEEYEDEEGE